MGESLAGPRAPRKSIVAAIVTLVAVLAASTAAVVLILAQQKDDPWGIHRREDQAAVFDRVWLTVSQNYFDSTFGGVDWPAMKERYRPAALAASNSAGLYADAIWPMLSQIDTSHLAAVAPDHSPTGDLTGHPRGKRGEALAHAPNGGGDLGGLTVIHDGKHWVVYHVRNGSEPERLGIGPGRVLGHFSVASIPDRTPTHMRADLVFARDGGGEETISYDFPLRAVGPIRRSERLPSGYMLIRFDIFDSISVDWAIDRLKEAKQGAILDLRYNQGGNIGQLQRLAGMLLPNYAPIGRSIGRMLTLPLVAPEDGAQYRAPVAVLIGPETASAAEMLSDSLRYNKRAKLIGDRTAGAVLTSRFWKLPDGGLLTVATGNFTTADGRRLEAVGVEPDIPAAETLETIRQNRDLVIEAAIAELQNTSGRKASGDRGTAIGLDQRP